MCEDELPLPSQHKVSEIREMIMEGEGRGNLMGGNHLDFSVILMSSCLFQIISKGARTPVCHRKGFYLIANLINTQRLVLCLTQYFLIKNLRSPTDKKKRRRMSLCMGIEAMV